MKNKAAIIIGFITGFAGFLLLFKFLFLDKIPREDEIAPGLVMLAAIFNGLLFAFTGSWVQSYLGKKKR